MAAKRMRYAPLLLVVVLGISLAGCGFFSTQTQYANIPSNAPGVLKTAYSQMGKKYRAGGASPQKGFDCSGLVWWSYKQNGVKIPRITTDQAKAGKAVAKKHAKPGDIVVFRTGNSPRGLHTGLYAGDGAFIHSPGTGKKVCLEKLSLPHWSGKLVSIRRIGP